MTAESRQLALDSITPEELAKVQAHQAKTSGTTRVDDEWMLLAEFAKTYGWQAYCDVKEDNIKASEMMTLIEANRKLEYLDMLRLSQAVFVATISARSKKPSQTFSSLTKDMISKAKTE